MDYVMIGNSAAAIGCIEGIRSVDAAGPITVISREPYHTYSRPLISYLLHGKTDEARMRYRAESFYKDHGCTPMLGAAAVKIDPEAKKVLLNDGRAVPYGRLLIATGSRPLVPPMDGLELVKNKFTFLSLDDAKALQKALTPESRVLIVGAGLIGLKCAEGIRHCVGSITVVDLADRILPGILDADGAAIIQKHIESRGVKFLLSDSVSRFTADSAELKSGRTVGFDVLVVAAGVRPNTELAAGIGAAVGRGILTDARCETTVPGVYAAGDCAEDRDATAGMQRMLGLLPNAYMQGETAGVNMAGGDRLYDKAIPMNAIGFFGLHVIAAGSYDGSAFEVKGDGSYKKLITKNGLLKGYILIGDVVRAGIYTSLIREKTPLASIDFELIKEKPQLIAFTAAERAAKLEKEN